MESTPAEAKGQETETTISGTTEPTRSREPETTTTVLEEEPGKGGGEGEAYSVGGTPEEPVIISHDNMQKLADEFGLSDVESRKRVSDKENATKAAETAKEWADKGEYAKNINELVDRAIQGRGVNDMEKHLLQQRIANVREEARRLQSDILSKEYDDKVKELERLKMAGQTLKSTAGATLRNSTVGETYNPTMADWMAERQEIKGKELTPEEKIETAKLFEDYEQKAKAAEEAIAKRDEEIAQLKADLALKDARGQKRTLRKVEQDSLKAERDDLINSIKEKWNKGKAKTSAAIVPYADRLIEIAPEVIKLARNLLQTGALKTSEVIDQIHSLIDDGQVTKKDIADMISGEYNVDSRLKAAKARAESSEASIRQQIKDENYEGKKRSLPIDENALLKKANPTLWKKTMDAIIKRDDARHKLEYA